MNIHAAQLCETEDGRKLLEEFCARAAKLGITTSFQLSDYLAENFASGDHEAIMGVLEHSEDSDFLANHALSENHFLNLDCNRGTRHSNYAVYLSEKGELKTLAHLLEKKDASVPFLVKNTAVEIPLLGKRSLEQILEEAIKHGNVDLSIGVFDILVKKMYDATKSTIKLQAFITENLVRAATILETQLCSEMCKTITNLQSSINFEYRFDYNALETITHEASSAIKAHRDDSLLVSKCIFQNCLTILGQFKTPGINELSTDITQDFSHAKLFKNELIYITNDITRQLMIPIIGAYHALGSIYPCIRKLEQNSSSVHERCMNNDTPLYMTKVIEQMHELCEDKSDAFRLFRSIYSGAKVAQEGLAKSETRAYFLAELMLGCNEVSMEAKRSAYEAVKQGIISSHDEYLALLDTIKNHSTNSKPFRL